MNRRHLKSAVVGLLVFAAGTFALAQQDEDGNRRKRDRDRDPPEEAAPEDLMDAHLADLAAQIVANLNQKNKSKIAVVEFSDLNGNISEFGQFVAEELITRLYRSGNFEVVERQLLTKVIEENTLSLTGLVDEASAKALGRILGVDAIATGSITDLGPGVKINARLISTETGAIFAVAATTLPKNDIVSRLMSRSVAAMRASKSGQGSATEADAGGDEVAVPDQRRVLVTVMNETEHGTYHWQKGAPYVTTVQAHSGRVGYIATGNNHFYKNLGRIGYESGEARFIRISVCPLKAGADMTLQVHIGDWNHRWCFSTQPTPRLFSAYPVLGGALNLPVGRWTTVTIDLIDDLGARPGQQIAAMAFSGNDGNLVYDEVVLLSN